MLAVHAALLPTGAGRILYFAGSQWVEPILWESIEGEPNPTTDPKYREGKNQIDHSRVYDCSTQQILNPGSPDADLFCSGHAFLPDGKLLVAGGTQHYGVDAIDLHHAHWSGSRETWLFDPHPEVKICPGTTVTAVWRAEHLDVFATGADGTVWTAWWESTRGWQPWTAIHPEVQKMHPGATVTAVWRAEHLDVFATGADGTVWTAWWESTRGWQPWTAIHPEVQKMHPGATVTAVWRAEHLDVFATGADGTVWTAWWESTPRWQPWTAIHPEVQKMHPGATVTAVWRAEHLDVFATGADGTVWTAWWESTPRWQPWTAIHPEVQKMHPGATVTAVWRAEHLDVFATGADGTVWTAWWESTPRWQPWTAIHPEVQKMHPGATVTAVWRAEHLDVFATGADGTVWTAWWESTPRWQPWTAIHPEVQKMHPGATVTAVWRAEHLDVFATGADGTVWTAWWESTPRWQPWSWIHAASWVRCGLLNRDPDQTQAGQPMGGGRWYPTLVTLPGPGAIAMCGHPLISNFTGNLADFDIRHNNTKPEVFDLRSRTWTLINKALGVDQAHDYAPYYPRLHVLPHTGEVFVVQPLYSRQVVAFSQGNPMCTTPPPGQDLCSQNPKDTHPPYSVNVMDNSLCYDVASKEVARAFPGPQEIEPLYVNQFFTSQETTSVMLPLLHEEGYHPRVLICGAPRSLIADLEPPSAGELRWTATAPRRLTDPVTHQPPVRNYVSSTLLPTGDVLISGGATKADYKEPDGVKTAEIYHPPGPGRHDSWELGPDASETRGYHSVALLMPDGRVWTAGSEWNHQKETPNLAIELFEPDYYSVANRVSVTAAPAAVTYSETFNIEFHSISLNTQITRVAFMRLGSATHAFDGDQRYVGVPFSQTHSTLTVIAPPDSSIAPAGYYMLWLIDSKNLPCKLAPFVQLASDLFP